MDGILNVYKEKGFTSHDVVAKLRGILKQKKIGHTGTLDPDAVGVLPICLGKGTKLCDMLTDRDKTYQVVMRLGITTDTEDMTGTILDTKEVNISIEEIGQTILKFVGEIEQIPPMYSALKVNGKKLYELAREGKVIERKPRSITIHSIAINTISLPLVTMTVSCSKGTYIRSLCRDIGETLGCGACMEQLTRTNVGTFSIEDSLTLSQIEEYKNTGELMNYLVDIQQVFQKYPKVHTKEKYDKLVYNGNPIGFENLLEHNISCDKTSPFCVYDSKDTFIGIFRYKEDKGKLYPEKMFFP